MSQHDMRIGRRGVLAGAAALATTAAVQTATSGRASAAGGIPVGPAPKPIPGGIDSGDPNVGFIHWWLPGPEGSSTPIIGIPGFGLDVDPSLITDFDGISAMAVVAGSVRGSDGVDYPCEFDVRAMKGRFVDVEGTTRTGAFAFL